MRGASCLHAFIGVPRACISVSNLSGGVEQFNAATVSTSTHTHRLTCLRPRTRACTHTNVCARLSSTQVDMLVVMIRLAGCEEVVWQCGSQAGSGTEGGARQRTSAENPWPYLARPGHPSARLPHSSRPRLPSGAFLFKAGLSRRITALHDLSAFSRCVSFLPAPLYSLLP